MTREPLTSDELENIDRLVKDAVGYDEARGDTISISNIAFFAEPDLGPIDDGGFLAGISMLGLVKQIVGALLVLAIAFGIVRPLLRNLSSSLSAAGTVVVASQPPPVMTAGSSQGRVAAAAPAPAGPLSYEDKMSVARQAADKDPERVAEIVRSWVQTDG